MKIKKGKKRRISTNRNTISLGLHIHLSMKGAGKINKASGGTSL